jgi:hypothetical protein
MNPRILRWFTCTLAMAIVFAAAMIAPPRHSMAGSLSNSIIGLFPKEVGEFAYADLKTARGYAWFGQLRDQLLPGRFKEFEQFLRSAGIDPNTQVDELAWAGMPQSKSGGEEIVGIALGQFDPSSAEAKFQQQKLPSIEVHGFHLYAFGSGAGAGDILFLFIDSNTAAFGHRAALEKLIDVRAGAADNLLTNSKMYPLINGSNGHGIIWAVLDQDYTHLAVKQLLPQLSTIPQAASIVSRMHAMTIDVEAESGVDAKFQAICDSSDDANMLSAAMQAGIMMYRYQAAQSNPALASLLEEIKVSPDGDRLKIEAPISQDELLGLIRSKAFSAPM